MNKIWVNCYEETRCYGGPEEGGWWYSEFEWKLSQAALTEAHAREVRERLIEEFPEWRVFIEDEHGKDHSNYRPYE